MLMILCTAALLVVTTVALHLFFLQIIWHLIARLSKITRLAVGLMILLAIGAHLVEIGVFQLGYELLGEEYGHLEGYDHTRGLDGFYYSAVTFTSLGYGDLVPVGPIRILSAVEALTGLVLITWTASFAFLVMERSWDPVNK